MFATIVTPVRNCLNLSRGAKSCQYISITLLYIVCLAAQTLLNLTLFQVMRVQT